MSVPGIGAAPITSSGTTGYGTTAQTLSDWVGPYATNMLGQAQAIAQTPYQTYQGPMTAGESGLQSKMFQGLGNLTFPQNLGSTFSQQGSQFFPPYDSTHMTMGGNPPGTQVAESGGQAGVAGVGAASQGVMSTAQQPTGVAQSYMNPYLQSVMEPQLAELRRQSQITQLGNAAKMTGAGAYGGSRQALMDAETQRNLMQEMNKTVGQGYATAFDKGMGQFNIEQQQGMGLAGLLAQQGQAQRGIEQEGISADYNEFLAQRDYPTKQVQFLQSMLQGLPIQTVTTSPHELSGASAAIANIAGLKELMKQIEGLKIGTPPAG